MDSRHHDALSEARPRSLTLAILRQFARSYCPEPSIAEAPLPGIILN